MVNTALYPYPEGFDAESTSAMQSYIDGLTTQAFVVKIIFNVIACFGAGLIASLVDRKYKYQSGGLAFIIMLGILAFRDFRWEYPTYYVVSGLAAAAIAGFAGVIVGGSRSV